MSISFKVGCNFDTQLPERLGELNDRYSSNGWRINEVFGSIPNIDPVGSARPSFRLQHADPDFLQDYVIQLKRRGIGLNYTMNISFVDPRTMAAERGKIEKFIGWLQHIDVTRITVSHPLVARMVHEFCDLPMEISTIARVESAWQLAVWKDRFPRIDKLCVDVFSNRNWRLLSELQRGADGVVLELLVNEFCVHQCIDRNQCYDIHSLDLSDKERRLHGNYPMGNCIATRIRKPEEWLRADFVLPQWLRWYADTFGIGSFKISGRTHPTDYIVWTAEQYMSGEYSGNLLELWANVENIGRAQDDYRAPRYVIDCALLPDDFLQHVDSESQDRDAYIDNVARAVIVREDSPEAPCDTGSAIQ